MGVTQFVGEDGNYPYGFELGVLRRHHVQRVMDWCRERHGEYGAGTPWLAHWQSVFGLFIAFRDPNDAMEFKIRWG